MFSVVSAGFRSQINQICTANHSGGASLLYSKNVPIEQSALLIIDAQDSFKILPRWERRNNRDFESNVARLISAYRAAGLPVIYLLHTDDDPGFETTSKLTS